MLRVLFVCPHFAPINAPDGHRVRLLLPHLSSVGIDAEVLSVAPSASHFPGEAWLAEGLPDSVPVHRVEAYSKAWGRIPGLGNLATRSFSALRQAGDRLLADRTFDAVYFSTTQFGVHLLGPRWKQRYGIPFFMDFQDPWVNDYYRDHPEQAPPGGRFKFGVADRFNRAAEPRVLSECSGITCVSPAYAESLAERYRNSPLIPGRLFTGSMIAPFPAEKAELDRVQSSAVQQSIFDPADGNRHWVYAGRCNAAMETSIRALFHALRRAFNRHAEAGRNVRFHFIGTSYSGDNGGSPIQSAAREFGIESKVQEIPHRIPLSESIRCLLDADALVVPGSDDPGYNASKLYPYLMAEKPLLAVFHRSSPTVALMRELGAGWVIPFSDGDSIESIGQAIEEEVFAEGLCFPGRPFDPRKLAHHTAKTQATRLENFFRTGIMQHSEESQAA